MPVLFHGWIDNVAELQSALDTRDSDTARLYGRAVEAWGGDADRHVIGTYASVVCMSDGAVRLSRSPWASFPLFCYSDGDVLLVSSLPRPIFAAGVSKRLRMTAVEEMLCMELPDDTESMFEGIWQVPHGSVTTVDQGGKRIDRWYDPLDFEPVRLGSDDEYVEAANALLADAVGSALRDCRKPGISLSGGLDSAMVCDEVLRQLEPGQELPSFTFRPLSEWDGKLQPQAFGDDWPYVQEFAKQHPALEPIAVDNRGIGFDDRAEQMFLACDIGHPSRVLGTVYHGVFDAAREHGCDWLLSAGLGNATFSTSAPWAPAELLRTGKLRQLWLLLSGMQDRHSVGRRFLAKALLPQLPGAMQRQIRKAALSTREADGLANPFLAAEGRLGEFRSREAIRRNFAATYSGASHREVIAKQYYSFGLVQELALGYEQVFGIRLRDVTAYRPLIEFCKAIPTDQFVRDGESRYLARRMARGRMPEAQRTNRLYGHHNIDWHARMKPRLGELRQQVEEMARHPDIGPLVDTDAIKQLLDEWPESTPDSELRAGQLRFFLPSLLYVTKYVDAMTGRNG